MKGNETMKEPIKTKKSAKNKKEDVQKKATKDIFWDYVPYIIIIIFVIIIRTYIATPIRVNGNSMDPTLSEGETMILNKIGLKKGIKRFDIIVVNAGSDYIIKRIIAMPGETIAYIDGKLYINGKYMEDKYSLSKTEDFDVVKLQDNEYFVMGDNRAISKDSRIIGPVTENQIEGKTNLVIFPFSKMGIVKK